MTFESRKSDYAGFEKVELSAAVHLALHELQFCDLTSVCPLDQGNRIAARTARMSLPTPLAKEATKLEHARSSQRSRSPGDLVRIIAWKLAMTSRASTSIGVPFSTAATVIVSAFESRSRLTVSSRVSVRAEGVRVSALASVSSALRRRAAHSLTTRRHPREPCCLSCRQSSAPLRAPAAHCSSSQGRYVSSELSRRHCHVCAFYLSNAPGVRRLRRAKSIICGSSSRTEIAQKVPILGERDNSARTVVAPDLRISAMIGSTLAAVRLDFRAHQSSGRGGRSSGWDVLGFCECDDEPHASVGFPAKRGRSSYTMTC